MKLGNYFTLSELTVTNTGLLNVPNNEQIVNLTNLVKNVLDPAREMFNDIIHVNSGFRSKTVNAKIGGAKNSQHMTGEAADITSDDNARLFKIIRDNFVFDQLIWEGGDDTAPAWIHVSFKTQGNRNEVLKMVKKFGKSTYKRI